MRAPPALALLLLVARTAAAAPPGPGYALALSGGGARGFAHIGVLRGLERCGVPIDVVAGTSMGSLVGALYALGLTPSELERIATETDWTRILLDERRPGELPLPRRGAQSWPLLEIDFDRGGLRVPSGLLAGARLDGILTRIVLENAGTTSFSALQIPFVAVASDLETGRPVTLRRGSLVESLRASMAVPGAFAPVALDGRLLVDGAIAENLPVRTARALGGARPVLAVDVSAALRKHTDLRSFLDVLDQVISIGIERNLDDARAEADVLLRPEIGKASNVEFGRQAIADLIRHGEEAVAAACPDLRWRLGLEGDPVVTARRTPPRLESAEYTCLELDGGGGDLQQLAQREMELLPGPASIRLDDLDQGLDRLRALDAFDRARVELEGDVLTLRLTPSPPLALAIGVRGDDRLGVLGRVAVVWRRPTATPRRLTLDALLGRDSGLSLEARDDRVLGTPIFLALRGFRNERFERVALDREDRGALRHRRLGAGLDAGIALGRQGAVTLSWEIARLESLSSAELPSLTFAPRRVARLVAVTELETRSDSEPDATGIHARARFEHAVAGLGGEIRYDILDAGVEMGIGVGGRVTAVLRARAGGRLSGTLPPAAALVAGGNEDFPGEAHDAFRGDRLFLAVASLWREMGGLPPAIGRRWLVGLDAALGRVRETVPGSGDGGRLIAGAALKVRLATRIGPIDAAAGLSREGHKLFSLSAGRRF